MCIPQVMISAAVFDIYILTDNCCVDNSDDKSVTDIFIISITKNNGIIFHYLLLILQYY